MSELIIREPQRETISLEDCKPFDFSVCDIYLIQHGDNCLINLGLIQKGAPNGTPQKERAE